MATAGCIEEFCNDKKDWNKEPRDLNTFLQQMGLPGMKKK